jgi:1,2-dihydroxy-3-keto-5-methylthiopentene dioxygenase
MSWLVITPEREPGRRLRSTSDPERIARELAPWSVRFERWPSVQPVHDDLLSVHAREVEGLCAAGYATVDVVRVAPIDSDPIWPEKAAAMRDKFRDEHTHAEDEVRFFAAGAGAFYLRLGGNVFVVLCEAGDLLWVPAGTRHWFDMGLVPRFTAIRFFKSSDGWVGNFTADPIARAFPSFDELSAEARATGTAGGGRAPAGAEVET